MVSTARENCDDHAKIVMSPVCESVPVKTENPCYPTEDGFHGLNLSSFKNGSIQLRCHEMGLVHRPRRKAGVVVSESEFVDDDAVCQSFTRYLVGERWLDQSESMSLSLNCMSPSLNHFDDRNVWDLDWCDISLDDHLFSVLPLSGCSGAFMNRRISLFDGSRINPIEEAALVLDKAFGDTSKFCEDDLHIGVTNLLQHSLEGDKRDSLLASSESADSDSSVFESSWTSLSTQEDSSSSSVSDFDRTGIWVSLLDLEREDFEWVSDNEQGLDASGSGRHGFSNLSTVTLVDQKSKSDSPFEPLTKCEAQFICDTYESDLEGSNTDEPLFWPFERNSYSRPETEWDHLCQSPPCDNRGKIGNPERFCSPKSIKLRVPEIKTPPQVQSSAERFARRILFRSRTISSTALGCRNGDAGINMPPSRLSNCNHGSSKPDSCKISMKKRSLQVKENSSLFGHGKGYPLNLQCPLLSKNEIQFHRDTGNDVKSPFLIRNDLKSQSQRQIEILDGDYEDSIVAGFKSNEEVPIETLVGLDEFNGHEGIEVDFDEHRFSLDGLISDP